eukprot:735160-Amorphochlora_amoeboformis.AAC.1
METEEIVLQLPHGKLAEDLTFEVMMPASDRHENAGSLKIRAKISSTVKVRKRLLGTWSNSVKSLGTWGKRW